MILDINNLSEANFEAPYKFIGLQALSVDTNINVSVFPTSVTDSITFWCPIMFVFILYILGVHYFQRIEIIHI